VRRDEEVLYISSALSLLSLSPLSLHALSILSAARTATAAPVAAAASYRRPVAVTTRRQASKSSSSMRPRVRPVGEEVDEAAAAWKGEAVVGAGVVAWGGGSAFALLCERETDV